MAHKLHQIRAQLEEKRTRRKQNLAQMHRLQSSSTPGHGPIMDLRDPWSGQPITTDQQNYLSPRVIPSSEVQGSGDRTLLSKQVIPLSGTWAALHQNNRI